MTFNIAHTTGDAWSESDIATIENEFNRVTNTSGIWPRTVPDVKYLQFGNAINNIVMCSATTFVGTDNAATYTGVLSGNKITWTGVDDKLTSPKGLVTCDADSTKLIAWSSTAVSFSIDSGATWTLFTTAPPNLGEIYNCHYITADFAIIAGDASLANDGWKNTNPDGDGAWSQIANGTMTTLTKLCKMYSATAGYFVDNSDNIFTYNASTDTVTDTTHDASEQNGEIIFLTSSSFIHVSGNKHAVTNDLEVGYYDGTQNEIVVCKRGGAMCPSNIIKATNNYYYFVAFPSGTTDGTISLFKSSDGLSWQEYIIGTMFGINTNAIYGPQLTEYTTNKFIFHMSGIGGIIDETKGA